LNLKNLAKNKAKQKTMKAMNNFADVVIRTHPCVFFVIQIQFGLGMKKKRTFNAESSFLYILFGLSIEREILFIFHKEINKFMAPHT